MVEKRPHQPNLLYEANSSSLRRHVVDSMSGSRLRRTQRKWIMRLRSSTPRARRDTLLSFQGRRDGEETVHPEASGKQLNSQLDGAIALLEEGSFPLSGASGRSRSAQYSALGAASRRSGSARILALPP